MRLTRLIVEYTFSGGYAKNPKVNLTMVRSGQD
jgi:hypothetical protein